MAEWGLEPHAADTVQPWTLSSQAQLPSTSRVRSGEAGSRDRHSWAMFLRRWVGRTGGHVWVDSTSWWGGGGKSWSDLMNGGLCYLKFLDLFWSGKTKKRQHLNPLTSMITRWSVSSENASGECLPNSWAEGGGRRLLRQGLKWDLVKDRREQKGDRSHRRAWRPTGSWEKEFKRKAILRVGV